MDPPTAGDDDPHRGRDFPPASEGQPKSGQGTGSSSRRKHQSQPQHTGHPRQTSGGRGHGHGQGQGQGLGSTPRGHEPGHLQKDKSGWRYWWVYNTRQGMEDFVRMVRERLNSLGAPEKLISYGGRLEMVNSKEIAEDLPREEAQQGRGAGGGQASPGDQERQQQPRVDFCGGFYCSLGISPIMEKVKSVFGPGGSLGISPIMV